jgi:hypothetical protein
MKTLELVKQRLEDQPNHKSALAAKVWLEKHDVEPVSDSPARITVAEAFRLWRTRLDVSTQTHHPIDGLSELVEKLRVMTRQKKIDQFGFLGRKSAATLLFEKSNGSYIGAAFVEQIPVKRNR